MTTPNSKAIAADETKPACSRCEGQLVPTRVETQLFVRRRGDTSRATWSTTHLDAWTCLNCGRTDLYAAEPERLIA